MQIPPKWSACLPILLLAGCSFSTPPVAPAEYTPVVATLVAAESGASVDVVDPDFGGQVSVTAGEHFTSAAGENCRRGSVLSVGREAEVVVICKQTDGYWRMAPRIWGQGLQP